MTVLVLPSEALLKELVIDLEHCDSRSQLIELFYHLSCMLLGFSVLLLELESRILQVTVVSKETRNLVL